MLTESSDGADLKGPQVSWHTSHNLQLPAGSPLTPTHPELAKQKEQSMTPLLWAETTCTITISRYKVVSELLHGAPNVVPHSKPGTKSKAKNFRCQGRKLSANSLYVEVFDAQSLIKEMSFTAFPVYPGF